MTNVAVIFHSGFGHTRVQAEAVHRGAASVRGVDATLIAVEDVESHWAALDAADATVSPEDLNRLAGFIGAMAQSNADQNADVVPPASDQRTAEHLGRRVAEATRRWVASTAAEPAAMAPA